MCDRLGHCPVPLQAPAPEADEAARGRGLPLRPPASMAPQARHSPLHCPQRYRALITAGSTPPGGRENRGLAGRRPQAPSPLRHRADHFRAFGPLSRSSPHLPPPSQPGGSASATEVGHETARIQHGVGPCCMSKYRALRHPAARVIDRFRPHLGERRTRYRRPSTSTTPQSPASASSAASGATLTICPALVAR